MVAVNGPVFKVAFAGDGNVGKTTVVHKYSAGSFQASQITTVGVDFTTHLVHLSEGRQTKLSVWEMSDQDLFAAVRAPFYRGSWAVVMMFGATG